MTDATARPTEPGSLRLALTLGFAGLVAGLVLVFTHRITRPVIEANRAAALQEAVYRVVPGAASMEKLVRRDGVWERAAESDRGEGVYAAYDDSGRLAGVALLGQGAGFQDTIRLLVGYDPGRARIVGMDVLESRETPGLGDKIGRDPDFVGAFRDLAASPEVVLVKDAAEAPNEVDAITGATISSRAVVDIVNDTCERWAPELGSIEPARTGAGS